MMRSPLTFTEQATDLVGDIDPQGGATAIPEALREVMTLAREELGMEAAFVAEMSAGRRIIRVVDGDGGAFGLEVDAEADARGTLCQALLDGAVPSSIPDVRGDPRIDVWSEDGDVGAWIGLPIVRPDGRVYGTLCCMSQRSDPQLARRDLGVMRLLARLLGSHLAPDQAPATAGRPAEDGDAALGEARERIRRAIEDPDIVRIVLQPIVSLATDEVVGFEALARFAAEPVRSPDAWFQEAAAVGLGVDLEVATLRSQLSLLRWVPEGMFLSVNVSPACIADRRLVDEIAVAHDGHLILELTEQDRVESYDELIDHLADLRSAGVGLAIDDVGSGFSSMTHVLQLEPDLVKLDARLTRGIELDPRRSTLISAMTRFADAARADLVAEGIETSRELETLRDVGVPLGQGFYLARPDAPAHHLSRATSRRRRGLVRRP